MTNSALTAPVPAHTPLFIPANINLCQLPFFASSTKNLRKKFIEYRDTIYLHDGKTIEILWQVSGDTRYGYPGPVAERVHHVIVEMAFEQGIPISNPVKVSLTEICRRLGYARTDPNTGRAIVDSRDRKRVKDAIRSIKMAGIVCESAWSMDGERVSLMDDDGVNLYERTVFVGDKDGKGKRWKHSAIWFSDFLLQSINQPYLRPVDRALIDNLSSRAFSAPKLYKHLGYLFAKTCFNKSKSDKFVDVPYERARALADIGAESGIQKAKNSFENAHQALLAYEVISAYEWIGEGRQSKDYVIRYTPGQRARKEFRDGPRALKRNFQLELFAKSSVSNEELHKKLLDIGFEPSGARAVLNLHNHTKIELHLEYLTFEQKRTEISNPPGWLRHSLKLPSYTPPKGFRSASEIEAGRRKKHEELRRRGEMEAHQSEEEARRNAMRSVLDGKLESLSKNEQGSITAEIGRRILEGANNFERDWLRDHPDVKQLMFLDKYYSHLEELLGGIQPPK